MDAAALLAHLQEIGIDFDLYEHEAVMTVAESARFAETIPGAACKCLFLRGKNGRHWLTAVPAAMRVDLAALARELASPRLSFGDAEAMNRMLGLRPGAVSILGVVNDTAREVTAVVESSLLDRDRIRFHPLINTATLTLAPPDLIRFLALAGHDPVVVGSIAAQA